MRTKLRSLFRDNPRIKDFILGMLGFKRTQFQGSKTYWENRYASNGLSGSGSYGRLAQYKAAVLNDFVVKNNIATVIEFGCGDGNQLSLANYNSYIGFDVSESAIRLCKKKFEKDKTKAFIKGDGARPINNLKADLTISLDVIYHLVEDRIFESHLRALFNVADKFVVIYSSNIEGKHENHERPRKFTSWIDENIEGWILSEKILNPYPYNTSDPTNTSVSDFYVYKKL